MKSEKEIRERIAWLYQQYQRVKSAGPLCPSRVNTLRHIEGNIGALEWVLREGGKK